VSVEQRILDIAEAPSWFYGKELRAIALEVRKREDRIKQLEEMYEGIPGERPDLLGTNVMGLLKRELIGTQKRIRHLESALRRIANQDYRGNRSTESQIAFEALKEVKL